MALRQPLPPPEPEPPQSACPESAYDDVLAASFPASDPPPGVIKLGPRRSAPPPPRPPSGAP
ncbi:MAG TPA: hypothetical protein VMV31_00190 [Terriglobales bacterium]|nr:hypothetical protein [Terriglobales bacterium]